MAKLGSLINGQDVTFDTHQAGDGQPVRLGDIHLEKRLHNSGGKARFPLLGNEEPSNSGMNDKDFNRVVNEVKKVLKKNKQVEKNLAETIVAQLNRFNDKKVTSETAKEAAKRLASYFDLETDFLRIVEEYSKNSLLSFTTIHFNPTKQTLQEIHQSKKEIIIQKPRRHNSLQRIHPHNNLN